MFEVQVRSMADVHSFSLTIFESVHLKEAQKFYQDSRHDYADVEIRLIEVLRHS